MGLRKTLQLAHNILEDAKIDHALIGGFALACLGIHRATIDINILIEGEKKEIANR